MSWNWAPGQQQWLEIDGVHVTISSACDHWVVYDEPPHATCVEPQTGPPDAFNIRPEVVEPGASYSADFQLRASIVGRRPLGDG